MAAAVTSLPLACTVRGCGLRLDRRDRAFVCPANHAFDVARSGYVNLLQPQDRKSLTAGDSKAALDARAALLAMGVGRSILNAFVARAADLLQDSPAGERPTVVDLGSGAGDALAALAAPNHLTHLTRPTSPAHHPPSTIHDPPSTTHYPASAIGIDLSTTAAERAARRSPALTWVVANADRRLPILDASVNLVLSLHGRRNPGECARILAPGGVLLVAVPAPDDLVELRGQVQTTAVMRERADTLLEEHAPFFTLVDRSSTREQHALDRDALLLLLRGTYRGARHGDSARVEALGNMGVTLASEFFLLAPRH